MGLVVVGLAVNYLFFGAAEAAEGAHGRFIALVRHVLPPSLDRPWLSRAITLRTDEADVVGRC